MFIFAMLWFTSCTEERTIWVSYYQADVGHTIKILDSNGNLIVEKEPKDISGVISWASKVKGYILITLDEKYETIQILSPSYNYKQVEVVDGMTINL